MPTYSLYDANGNSLGAIKATPEHIDKFVPEGGSFVLDTELDKPLDGIKKDITITLMNAITTARNKLVTNLPGQDMVYLRKEDEAKKVILDTNPEPQNYPILSGEIGITAPTLYEIAQIILYKANYWQKVAGALERIRHQETALIQQATEETVMSLTSIDYNVAINEALNNIT